MIFKQTYHLSITRHVLIVSGYRGNMSNRLGANPKAGLRPELFQIA